MVHEALSDFVKNHRVINCRGHRPWIAISDFLHGPAHDLSGPRLWQPADDDRDLEGRDRTNPLADQPDNFFFDLGEAR